MYTQEEAILLCQESHFPTGKRRGWIQKDFEQSEQNKTKALYHSTRRGAVMKLVGFTAIVEVDEIPGGDDNDYALAVKKKIEIGRAHV